MTVILTLSATRPGRPAVAAAVHVRDDAGVGAGTTR
jgi:hypothetical protein